MATKSKSISKDNMILTHAKHEALLQEAVEENKAGNILFAAGIMKALNELDTWK